MTIKELRAQLRAWGKFWRAREEGTGYASVSITYQMMQTGLLGIASSSTKHLFSHQSDQLNVPDWVQEIDRAVSDLTPPQKGVINALFVKNMQLNRLQKMHLAKAESLLLGKM